MLSRSDPLRKAADGLVLCRFCQHECSRSQVVSVGPHSVNPRKNLQCRRCQALRKVVATTPA